MKPADEYIGKAQKAFSVELHYLSISFPNITEIHTPLMSALEEAGYEKRVGTVGEYRYIVVLPFKKWWYYDCVPQGILADVQFTTHIVVGLNARYSK